MSESNRKQKNISLKVLYESGNYNPQSSIYYQVVTADSIYKHSIIGSINRKKVI